MIAGQVFVFGDPTELEIDQAGDFRAGWSPTVIEAHGDAADQAKPTSIIELREQIPVRIGNVLSPWRLRGGHGLPVAVPCPATPSIPVHSTAGSAQQHNGLSWQEFMACIRNRGKSRKVRRREKLSWRRDLRRRRWSRSAVVPSTTKRTLPIPKCQVRWLLGRGIRCTRSTPGA